MTTGHLLYSPQLRPQSPSGSPGRIRIPRKPVDEVFPSSPTRVSVLDPERRSTERSSSPNLSLSMAPAATLQKVRRPSSPLCQVAHASTGSVPVAAPATPSSSSLAISPSYRQYDSFSGSYGYSAAYPSSSVPSTPTSARSRSPSISSLETIPDSPDAEEAALEAERIAQLKAAVDAAEGADVKGRSSLDVPTRGRTLSGFSSRDKRKRWSVCGAERRQDLDLETIWED
ncbi:b2d1c7ba-2a0e-44ed-882c-f9030c6b7459 [Thermothielavioides terrestris]|nr:b2d1c7ba-2a0e-44ed-882c-f9030c6b7459 [Thermothielavioides terrestris]